MSFPARRLRAKAARPARVRRRAREQLRARRPGARAVAPRARLGRGRARRGAGVSSRGELSIPLGQPASGRGVVRLTPDGLRLLGRAVGEPGADRAALGGAAIRRGAPPAGRPRRQPERHRRSRGPGEAGPLPRPRQCPAAGRPGWSSAGERAQAEVRLDGGNLELTRLGAQWPGLVVAASGHAGDGAIAFTGRLDAELGRLGPALGVTGIGGRATLTVDARGRGEAIEAAGTVRAPQLQFRGASVSDVELPLRWSRSILRLEKGQARLGTSRISADASASWKSPLTAESLARRGAASRPRSARRPRASKTWHRFCHSALQGRGELALAARAEGTPDRGAAPEPSRPRSSSSGRGRSASCAPRSTWTGRGSM